MTRVICVGHSLLPIDNAGPQLCKRLRELPLPSEVELIDGGLQGLNLLCCFENCRRVILIDNVHGYRDSPGIVQLRDEQICAAVSRHHDHAAGLAYLLALLPRLVAPLPRIDLLGIEGELNPVLERQVIDALFRLLDIGMAA